jgi:hypothetical protein
VFERKSLSLDSFFFLPFFLGFFSESFLTLFLCLHFGKLLSLNFFEVKVTGVANDAL